MCVCVCVCVCVYVYVCVCVCVYKDPYKFPDKCLGFRLELVDEFTKIVPSTFGYVICHHQGLLASVKSVFCQETWKDLNKII